jgi:hypothetical protein
MSEVVIKVIKAGMLIENHTCGGDWIEQLSNESTEDVWVTNRICTVCGRTEKTTEGRDTETFESIFEKFHGKE